MGSIWQSAPSDALGPGVYGVPVAPPQSLPAEGTSTALILEQFPWGPSLTTYDPDGLADLISTFYPPGMNRNAPGPLAIGGKGWPDLRVYRVTAATGTLIASAIFASSVPTTIFTVALKYVGTAGNAVVGTISAPSDGVSGHVNLAVTCTGASGVTTDNFPNLDATSALTLAASAAVALTNAKLVGSITWDAAGTVVNGSVTFTSGADGAVAATDYVGTVGAGDKGLAYTEGEDDINLVCFGDPGSSLRAACNAGMLAHLASLGRRVGFMTGNAGQAASAAQTDVATYRLDQNVYVDPWMKKISDQDSTIQTVPAAAMAMSVAAQLQPSSHISWRDPSVAAMMTDVFDVEQTRGTPTALQNSKAGICTLIKKKGGGFAFYTDATSNAPANPAQGDLATIRMGQYIIISAEDGFQSNVEGPNVPYTQTPMRTALTSFMETLVFNSKNDPAHNPYVKSYSLGDPQTSNPDASLDAGDYTIPVKAKTDRGMIRIFIPLQYGPTVTP